MKTIKKYGLQRILRGFGNKNNETPAVGSVQFGDLYRTTPIGRRYGFSRGGALDRVYIEKFLTQNQSLIKGRVLEVANNDYTMRFGGSNIKQSDVIHVNDSNPKATIIADLGQPLQIEEGQFDCIILTQTLQFIYDCRKAIENCYRLLKPGGHLLLTVPGITPIGRDPFDWYWSFTSFSMNRMFAEHFKKENYTVQTYGNVLAAAAFLYNLGKTEIDEKAISESDPSYQVIIAVTARK